MSVFAVRLSSLPLLAGMAGCFLGGAATDWLSCCMYAIMFGSAGGYG